MNENKKILIKELNEKAYEGIYDQQGRVYKNN